MPRWDRDPSLPPFDPKVYMKEWKKKNPEKVREQKRRKKFRNYGITINDYEVMLRQQDFCCAICGRPESAQPHGVLCVDHDHETGKVRGLLCNQCNSALGMINEDPEVLHCMLSYIAMMGGI